MKTGEDMKMIIHAADAVQMALLVLKDAPEILEKPYPAGLEHDRTPVFGRKDDMVIDLGIG
jgi:hypothetical protein